jgi:membrane fusion protein (multidrug efflux system)
MLRRNKPPGCPAMPPLAQAARSAAIVSLAPLAVAFLAGCDSQAQGNAPHGFPPAEVSTVTVATRSFPVVFEYVGQTQGSKDVEVRARANGIVERKLFREGSPVKAGQPLFEIDPRPYQAQVAAAEAELAKAQAQRNWSDREAKRLAPLAASKAIGQKEADDAASNAELAAAAVKAAQARLDELRLNLGYTRVVAPIAGLTSRAEVSEGSLAAANQTLLTTISQINPIRVVFTIAETEQLRLERAVAGGGLSVPKDNAYEVTVKLADGRVLPRQGRIDFADTRINPATGTYEVRAELPNADGALKPGQFVRVILRGAARNDAVAVPQRAVLEGPQGKFVFVAAKDKDGKDVALPRGVAVGDWVDGNGGNLWLIESGLKPGDTVIVDGVAKLRPGAPIRLAAAAPAGAAPAGAAPAAAHAPAGNASAVAPAPAGAKPAATDASARK